MTPREPRHPLRRILTRSYRAFLRAWATRLGLRAAAAAALVITVAFAFGVAVPAGEAVARVRLALVALLAAAAIGWAVVGYRRVALGFESFLERIEQRFATIRSWLRNALDFESSPPHDTSPELAQALAEETARRVDATPLESLVPRLEARRPAAAMLLALGVIAALALAFPQRAARSWATLWNPGAAAPPLRLEVEPGSVTVTPGAALAVHARVWGSPRQPTLLRDGERPISGSADGRAADGARAWRFDLSQLTREQTYRVRVAGVESPRYRIALAGEPIPVGFEIEYRSPAYARLPVQRGGATRGDLSALRGSVARVEVTFDRDLTALDARLPGGAIERWKALTARRWQGEVALAREGEYQLEARAPSGQARYRYRITPLADAPPVIAVRLPTGDVDLPAGQQIPVEVLGQDDLGLTELRLQFRKEADAPWSELPLARFAGDPREATVQKTWDASPLALLPGQSATFRFELEDNNAVSGRGRAYSPTFELRFPGLTELYDRLDQKQGAVQGTLEKVAEQAHELQESLDKLARQPRPVASQPAFERSEELKSTLQRQQDVSGQIEQATRQLQETIDQAAERQAFDQELMQKLQEMSDLMRQIQSQEFKEALKQMQEAMQRLDRQALEQNLPQWRQDNQEMLSNLERTIDLLKQLRQEERLQSLAQRAKELKQQQDALNREHGAQESRDAKSDQAATKGLAERQQHAAEQSKELAGDTRQAASQMQNAEDRKAMEQAAGSLDPEASQQQQQAAEAAAQRQSEESQRMGGQASESLSRAADQLGAALQAMQQRRQGVDLAAVRRAGQDLVSLQRESEQNLSSDDPVSRRADGQTDLSDGVSRVADSLADLARKSPFISPRLGMALGRAIERLSTSGRQLGIGNRTEGEQAGHEGSSSLNEAVLELRRIESSMCKSGGQSGGMPSPSAGSKVTQLGEQQARLNAESQSIARRLSEQMRLSAGDRGQMRRYADEQRRLREQLEQIQRDEETRRQLLGRLDQTRREMKEVEEILESGATGGDLEQKQQHILSRLLDAQRSINRRDFDPQRESRPGQDVERASAPELPPDLLRETDRLRLNLLRAEADRYPAQYRAFIETYLRRLNGSRR